MSKFAADAIGQALEPFEGSLVGFRESAIVDALQAIRESVPVGDQRRWWAEWAAGMFHATDDGKSIWGTVFAPAMVFRNDAGHDVYVPDIKDADEETINYWTTRSQVSKHSILRARYADLAWEFAQIVAQPKRDFRNARTAIDAYVDASRLTFEFSIEPIRYLERALDLALSISDLGRTQAVASEMFTLYDRIADPSRAGTFPFLFDSLYADSSMVLTTEQIERIRTGLELVLTQSTEPGASFNPVSAEGAASRLAIYYRREMRLGDVSRVWRTYGMSMEEAAKSASPMLALAWLHPILAIYTREGLRDEADRVNRFLSSNEEQLTKEFKTISAGFKIPPDKLKAFVDSLTEGGLSNALALIAAKFITRTEDAKSVLEDGAKHAPLQAMIPIQKVRDGHVVAMIGSVESDPEGRLINQLAQNIGLQTVFLHATVERLRERYDPSASEVSDWVCESGLFAGRHGLLTHGLAAFFNGDDITAVHVLLPQIESGLRQLGAALGLPTKKLTSTGLMEDKNLSDILRGEAFCDAVGEDIVNYLRALLNDKCGHNIRNEVLHGVVSAAYFNRQISLRIVHVVLMLGVLRGKQRAASGE